MVGYPKCQFLGQLVENSTHSSSISFSFSNGKTPCIFCWLLDWRSRILVVYAIRLTQLSERSIQISYEATTTHVLWKMECKKRMRYQILSTSWRWKLQQSFNMVQTPLPCHQQLQEILEHGIFSGRELTPRSRFAQVGVNVDHHVPGTMVVRVEDTVLFLGLVQ